MWLAFRHASSPWAHLTWASFDRGLGGKVGRPPAGAIEGRQGMQGGARRASNLQACCVLCGSLRINVQRERLPSCTYKSPGLCRM